MSYRTELDYLIKVLNKMGVQCRIIGFGSTPEECPDMGLRAALGINDSFAKTFSCPGTWAIPNTVYKLTDRFMCNYIFFLFPEGSGNGAMLIGPYHTFEKSRTLLLETVEHTGVSAKNFARFEALYATLPLLRDKTPLLSMVNALGETLWGENSFQTIDTEQALVAPADMRPADSDGGDGIIQQMKTMEKHYLYENELLDAVARGASARAELLMSRFSLNMAERRSPDPVRNAKIYCFICCTLLRKATEQGGVHPFHLDVASREFSRKIETIGTADEGVELMKEMVRSYCRLVRRLSTAKYSPFVRRTIGYIDSNIAGELSLSALAALQNVNASYLSTQFRREVGQTVTEYVTEKRMDAAARLLRSTNLQIQTVAQHCGISDVNYFSKLFKKKYGITPRQFRLESPHPSV